MSFSKVYSVQNILLNAQIVDIECDVYRGMNAFNIVGLGDKAIDEAKDRISSGLKGIVRTEETREKIRAANVGTKRSEEAKQKMREKALEREAKKRELKLLSSKVDL